MNRMYVTISDIINNRVNVDGTTLRPIEFLVISPSTALNGLVEKYVSNVPGSVRALLRGMGALNREGRPLISYLLFEAGFCRELMELGYQDGLKNRQEILKLLCPDNPE